MGDPPKAFIMSTKGTVTIRPRKMITNRLLCRRQMILDVHHPGLATPDKEMLKNMIAEYLSKAKGHKASSEATVIFGMKSKFGGSRSSWVSTQLQLNSRRWRPRSGRPRRL